MNWARRMNVAIEHIEANLGSELAIDEIAKVACCSKYHFQRMFLACFKVTCAEYIRRRKLTLAATEVVNTEKRIVDIALTYGYDSPNAFTRAFRKQHGINPSAARSEAVSLRSYGRARSAKDNGGGKVNYQILKRPEFGIIGTSKRFDFDGFVKEGPQFWKQYVLSKDYQKLYGLNHGRAGSKSKAPLLSAYFPQENKNCDEFLDVLGLEATSKMSTDGFETHTIPAATYAEFNCSYKNSMKTNRYIYGEWFSATGYERDPNKPDIAAYFPIAFRPMSEMQVRWWIPVVRR